MTPGGRPPLPISYSGRQSCRRRRCPGRSGLRVRPARARSRDFGRRRRGRQVGRARDPASSGTEPPGSLTLGTTASLVAGEELGGGAGGVGRGCSAGLLTPPLPPARPGSRVARMSRLGTTLRTLGSCDVLLEKQGPSLWYRRGSSGRGAAGQLRIPARRGSHRRCYSSACASDEPCSEGTPGPQFSSFVFLTSPLARPPDARAP